MLSDLSLDGWLDYHRSTLLVKCQGLTGEQQFFLAFGQEWATKTREQAERQQILVDVHSPGEFRAAEVRNIGAWYQALNVQPGQKLYLAPDARVQVW